MKNKLKLLVSAVLLAVPVWSAEADIFDFFEAEAEAIRLVTASRLPQSARWAPATIYVVTAEDIQASGAKTFWDALRGVPGVDVMATRTFYGEVSIRGLNRALGNRTLVLLDGRTVLNGPFDATFWEGIPAGLEEVDRIEVVEGPASALYGANAVNGVVNIITKAGGGASEGGRAAYTFGERRTHLGSVVYGGRRGRLGYQAGGGWRRTNRFEDGGEDASEVGKVHGFVGYDLSENARLRASGGLVGYDTQFSLGRGSSDWIKGTNGFLRADFERGNTRLRAFWNRGRPAGGTFQSLTDAFAKSDLYDVNLEHSLSLPHNNQMVAGASYRRNTMRSNVYAPDRIDQNLWAVFFEHAWRPGERVSLVSSARLDRHPLTGWVFSPRSSLVFSPSVHQTFRVSAGSSFRSPTLTESNVSLTQTLSFPGAFPLEVHVDALGNQDLEPERMQMVEAAHSARFGPVKTTAAGYHYRLRHTITMGEPWLVTAALPTIRVGTSYINLDGDVRAWGGEMGADVSVNQWVTASANYAYQRLEGKMDVQVSANGGPRHKLNGGIRVRSGRVTVALQAHWVGETFWDQIDMMGQISRVKVDGYGLLNGRIGYAFSGRLEGLDVSLEAFNLVDHKHFEILADSGEGALGQGGEIIRRRATATVSYSF